MHQRGQYLTGGKGPWNGFSAFQVFADHEAMSGFFLAVRLVIDAEELKQSVIKRSQEGRELDLDPDLARSAIRAGIGLVELEVGKFVLATSEETIVIVRPEALQKIGDSLGMHDLLISRFAARLARVSGQEFSVLGEVYEFPDLCVAAKAIVSAQQHHENTAIDRAWGRLDAQLLGQGSESPLGDPPAQVEQKLSQLGEHGIDIARLPNWWICGVAAHVRNGTEELFDPVPTGAELQSCIVR